MKLTFYILSKDLSRWKIVSYSCAIIGMPLLGYVLGEISNVRYLRQSLEAVPVLVCLIFVLRLPERPRLKMSRLLRVLFLLAPLPLFSFADLGFAEILFQQDAAFVLLIIVECIAIGVSEELTFRYGLFRLWSQYSGVFYVMASSLIFGILHFPDGIEAIFITTIIAVTFALARIAGMPIAALIVLHGFIDIPGVMTSMGLAA